MLKAIVATVLGLTVVAIPVAAGTTPSELRTYSYMRPVKYHPGDTERDPHHNTDFTVRVRVPGGVWQDLYEHNVQVDWNKPQNASIVYFDFKGRVEVVVQKNNGDFSRVAIRPTARGIKPLVKGGKVYFSLTKPENLSVEFDGDRLHNLHILAGDLSVSQRRPTPGPNVTIFGPGVHKPQDGSDTFKVSSGETVFIDGEAILEGAFAIENLHDVTILGRGMLETPRSFISVKNSRNVRVEGISVRGNFSCKGSQHVTFADIKVFTAWAWGDGVNVYSCKDFTLDRAFVRSSDDCFTIYAHRNDVYGDARDIRVTNSVFWADVAHAMFIGIHGNTDKPEVIENALFKNIDVLDIHEEQPEYQGVMAISAGDSNLVRNITFEDVRVENIKEGMLFNFHVGYNEKYNTSPGRGIENVLLRHVRFTGNGTWSPSVIAGYDASRRVRHVVLDDVVVGGKKLTATSRDLLSVGAFADEISYR